MTSRRKFLAALPALGASAALPVCTATQSLANSRPLTVESTTLFRLQAGWHFRLDPSSSHDPRAEMSRAAGWQNITVPHTWQTIEGSPEFVGVAWYKIDFDCPVEWQRHFVRVEFEAVFHTAHVYLNEKAVGEHVGKGYTAFACDLSDSLHLGQTNTLLVRVDNTPSDTMLPRLKSFDWANDGGLVRPVSLLLSPRVFVERMEIDTKLNLKRKSAEVTIRAIVRNTLDTTQTIRVTASVQQEGFWHKPSATVLATASVVAASTAVLTLPPIHVEEPKLWHFDAPHLYQAAVDLNAGEVSHGLVEVFGIRSFEVQGTHFYLNGEPVRLMGVERMAGSHPEFGMAEPTAWIESNHRDIKDLNCAFTRVHWAQDKRVLDFCDRNGILIQEEVPAWGPSTFSDTTPELQRQLEQNGLEQLREMIYRDRNHPSIVCWGLCNEVDGKNPRSRAFAQAISAEARRLDPSRLQTYASHTLNENPESDMAGELDFISTNEYFGSWYPGGSREVHDHIDRICKAFPGKPIVVSEYGWCECQPSIPQGDQRRVDIVNGHTEVFRDFPEIAGAIYFDYNDYRTLVGDKGTGSFRQRVHGVVDLYASHKPSFDALRLQASPIEFLTLNRSTPTDFELKITSRKTLPAYTMLGYSVHWVAFGYDDLPMEGRIDDLPTMLPGTTVTLISSFSQRELKRIAADILRPTGYSVASAVWHAL